MRKEKTEKTDNIFINCFLRNAGLTLHRTKYLDMKDVLNELIAQNIEIQDQY